MLSLDYLSKKRKESFKGLSNVIHFRLPVGWTLNANN